MTQKSIKEYVAGFALGNSAIVAGNIGDIRFENKDSTKIFADNCLVGDLGMVDFKSIDKAPATSFWLLTPYYSLFYFHYNRHVSGGYVVRVGHSYCLNIHGKYAKLTVLSSTGAVITCQCALQTDSSRYFIFHQGPDPALLVSILIPISPIFIEHYKRGPV
jgi:hypothetical protein